MAANEDEEKLKLKEEEVVFRYPDVRVLWNQFQNTDISFYDDVTNEINDAMEIIGESLCVYAAQVWLSSNSQLTKDKFAIKLMDSRAHAYEAGTLPDDILYYYSMCDTLPLKFGEGISGKTLQSSEPQFCEDVDSLENKGLLVYLPPNSKWSCFVMCLRSTQSRDDFAFEFLWPKTRNYHILLESLLFIMKRCLPNFTLASGAQLGDEIPYALEKLMRLMPLDFIPEMPKVSKVKQQFGRSINKHGRGFIDSKCTKAKRNWKEPRCVRTNLSNLCGSQVDSNLEDFCSSQEDSACSKRVRYPNTEEVVIINAEYGDRQTLLYIPITSGVVSIKVNVAQIYKLSPNSYKLQFLDFEEDWICLEDDQHWDSCIESRRRAGTDTIRLRVISTRPEA